MRTREELRREASALEAKLAAMDESEKTPVVMKNLHDEVQQLHADALHVSVVDSLAKLIPVSDEVFGTHRDLGTALVQAGFNRKSAPSVTLDRSFVDFETKAGSLDGGSAIEDAVPVRYRAPNLGIDGRYIYPHLTTEGVAADTTGVNSYRQKSRTFPSPITNMVRDIDATNAKPETATAAEVVSAELKQIASISSGTPNVLLANDNFRQWVNTDLVAAYRAALDTHIVAQLTAASIGGAGGGANIYEQVAYAQEQVLAQGYNPNLIVLSPGDSLDLRLLQTTGGDAYMFSTPFPANLVTSSSVDDGDGLVMDAAAIGILFLSPFSLQAFEEEAGSTNTSTVRGESNGLFVVQRETAAAYVAAGS